jgi:CHASE2 domain-containing sensor protein
VCLRRFHRWNLHLAWLGIPGVLIGALVVNKLGRRNLLLIGFGGYLLIGLIVFCAYDKLVPIVPLFIVLYGLIVE